MNQNYPMTTNLGKLLQAVAVLDEAAGLAPLNRQSHCAVQLASQELRTALPELWEAAKLASRPEEIANLPAT